MTTDTPRTDAEIHRSYPISGNFARQLEREITEIRNALGDDGRRTHKEFLVLATKASQWREWKEKYIDLRNAHIAEGQDPAGTIWEHADKLQKDLKETKAEVENLRNELENWDYGTRAKREQERAEKAEANLRRAIDIAEALSSELYFPDFVAEIAAMKTSLSSPPYLEKPKKHKKKNK